MADAKIKITAQDDTSKGISSAKQSLGGLSQTITAVSTGFLAATTAASGAMKVLEKVGQTVADLTMKGAGAADEMQRFSTLLGSREAAGSLISNLDRLDDITLATKDDLSSFAQELVVMGKTESEINSILEATVNLSNTSGRSFSECQNAIQRALTGTTSAIGKIMPELNDLDKAAWDNGEAFQYMNDKLGEASVTIASGSFSQKLDAISTSWQRIQENIGGVIVANIQATGILDSIYGVLGKIEENTANGGYGTNTTKEEVSYWQDIFENNSSAVSYLADYLNNSGNPYLKAQSSRMAQDPWAWVRNALKNGTVNNELLGQITGFTGYGKASMPKVIQETGYDPYKDQTIPWTYYNDKWIANNQDAIERNRILGNLAQSSPRPGQVLTVEEEAKLSAGEFAGKMKEELFGGKSFIDYATHAEELDQFNADRMREAVTAGINSVTTSVLAVGNIVNRWANGYDSGDIGGSISDVGSVVSLFDASWGAGITAAGGLVSAVESLFSSGSASTSAASQAAATIAQYNGATTIHINNYFNGANIVGSDGMAELASIIQEELDNQAYRRT